MSNPLHGIKKFISDDGMSLALFSLFLLCIAGQSLSGWFAYNQSLRSARFPVLSFSAYLHTGQFLDGIFSNWQAALLQLAVLIAFSAVLRQKGAAHSRKGDRPDHRKINWKITPRPTFHEWLYANSLSLAFVALFATAFLLHLWFGSRKHNENLALRHLPPEALASYAASPSFWFSVFQCWEAEFAVIAIYIVLSIFLRQESSAESKPLGSRDETTGDTNA